MIIYMAKKIIKKITLNSIAESIEELMRMTASGFENTVSKTEHNELKSNVENLQSDVSDIKLRLNNLAPKFEVDDLEKRVKRLEIKAKIR